VSVPDRREAAGGGPPVHGARPPSAGTQGARALSASAQKVQEAIAALGLPHRVVELDQPVRTAAGAAAAVGCEVGQIVKSLVFRGETSGRPVLVLASGAHRVNEARLAERIGERVARADPDFVRSATGFSIGGVPPLGHAREMTTFIDEDLMRFDQIWAAAGHPNSLFRLPPADLLRMAPGAKLAGIR
jgi:prolyl-tRNA editing enzyme YbaK/EbsC (Cys-tRNA(Pro) deacylase)